MRTRVKICGITNTEDARAAVDYGADALGFIMVPDSPRFIFQTGRKPIYFYTFPPFVSRVYVYRNLSDADPLLLTDIKVIDRVHGCVQYYHDDIQSRITFVGTQLIHAFSIKDENSLNEITEKMSVAHAVLLDTYHKDKLGGSGETFNWELAVEAKRRFDIPIILAGGLTPDNVEEAIATVRPYAVDVSSGVEAEPGRKDHAKLKAFFDAVRRADSRA
jgi:phosphoribosylanthranilate isomerase